eukprot:NODE_504_length_7539_cov_0.176613.p3 type:complete len:179 gc:universal NODE_504_length_7539_cov_0.176613:6457-6993(+)
MIFLMFILFSIPVANFKKRKESQLCGWYCKLGLLTSGVLASVGVYAWLKKNNHPVKPLTGPKIYRKQPFSSTHSSESSFAPSSSSLAPSSSSFVSDYAASVSSAPSRLEGDGLFPFGISSNSLRYSKSEGNSISRSISISSLSDSFSIGSSFSTGSSSSGEFSSSSFPNRVSSGALLK